MTWVTTGAAVVSVVGGIAGAIGESKKRKNIRRLNAMNRQRLETQAQAVERQTEEDVISLRQVLTKVVGEQRAGWGASGLSSSSGNALDVLASSITTGLNDQRRRREQGAQEAADLRYAGEIGSMEARARQQESKSAAASSLISGVGQAAVYGLKIK